MVVFARQKSEQHQRQQQQQQQQHNTYCILGISKVERLPDGLSLIETTFKYTKKQKSTQKVWGTADVIGDRDKYIYHHF